MQNITGFHTFWTRPKDSRVTMPDYELLTLIASILTWKKHNGPIHLVTDNRGLKFLQKQGIAPLYDQVSTDLEKIPQEINPNVFWAGAKLFAYAATPAPCVSIDMDAVVWQKLPELTTSIACLHFDDKTWPCYEHNQRDFTKLGFYDPEWDWSLQPCNVGVLLFRVNRTKKYYTNIAISFMKSYSALHPEKPTKQSEYLDPMVFAEQRLLPMAAQRLQEKISVYGKLSDTFHLETNPYISHIWNSKGVYKEHPEARAPFCKWMKDWLLKNHPEATAILDKLIPEPAQHVVGSYSTNEHFTIVGAVKPGTLIRDANVNAFRPAKAGDTLYFGEKLVAP